MLVEQFLTGKDYRILVINDQVVAVAERVPAHVVGDGKHTIAELVELANRDPRRGIGHEKVLTRITINEQAERLLEQAGYTAGNGAGARRAVFPALDGQHLHRRHRDRPHRRDSLGQSWRSRGARRA